MVGVDRLTSGSRRRRAHCAGSMTGGWRAPAAPDPERWTDQLRLQVVEESVILSVRADPEPGDLVALEEPEGTVSQGDANRVEALGYEPS
jgi:hypothetical protein